MDNIPIRVRRDTILLLHREPIDVLLSSLTHPKNYLQAENDAIGQELQKQLEAAGKIF